MSIGMYVSACATEMPHATCKASTCKFSASSCKSRMHVSRHAQLNTTRHTTDSINTDFNSKDKVQDLFVCCLPIKKKGPHTCRCLGYSVRGHCRSFWSHPGSYPHFCLRCRYCISEVSSLVCIYFVSFSLM